MSIQVKKVNMEVPENMIEQMRAYMERLQLDQDSGINENKQNNILEENNDEFEVSGIHDHRIIYENKWQFQVSWKGYNTYDWIDDEYCNCEKIISEYLSGKDIHTAYLFCRVSTPEQNTSVNVSLEAQESELRKAVSRMKEFNRIRVYNISQSAYKGIPKVLQNISNACLPYDGILFWRVDRMSRNIIKYLAWMEDLNDRGVMLYSHNEGITYKNNKLSFLQAVLDAQKEASILGERLKLAYRRKRERGDECVGRLPYGKQYQRILNGDGTTIKKIVVDNPIEKAVIERIRLSKKNAWAIAEELNQEGIYKKNKRWNRMMILRIKRFPK